MDISVCHVKLPINVTREACLTIKRGGGTLAPLTNVDFITGDLPELYGSTPPPPPRHKPTLLEGGLRDVRMSGMGIGG